MINLGHLIFAFNNIVMGKVDYSYVPAHLALHYLMFLLCVPTLLLSLRSTAALLLATRINMVIHFVLLHMLLTNIEYCSNSLL